MNIQSEYKKWHKTDNDIYYTESYNSGFVQAEKTFKFIELQRKTQEITSLNQAAINYENYDTLV